LTIFFFFFIYKFCNTQYFYSEIYICNFLNIQKKTNLFQVICLAYLVIIVVVVVIVVIVIVIVIVIIIINLYTG